MSVRVGISGLGSIGQQHARAFTELGGVEVVAFDPDPRRRAEATERGWAVTDSFDALMQSGAAALVVATPDVAHVEQAQAGIAAGMAVLLEKPIAERLATAKAARESLRAGRVVVGYVLRHRRALQRVKGLLADSVVGLPVSFQVMLGARGTIAVAKARFATPERNRLYRDYSHEWDYLRWFFGPVAEVTAAARSVEGVGHEEHPNAVDALLVAEAGVTGAVHIDYIGDNRTLTILGTEGVIFADLSRGHVVVREGGSDVSRIIDASETPGEALRRQAVHLLEVSQGAEPKVTVDDGIAALAVAEALVDSAQTRMPVRIPPE